MKPKSEREYRDMTMNVVVPEDIEERAEGEDGEVTEPRFLVEGYASTFNEPYTLTEGEDYVMREVIDAKAFDNTDMSDVIMQYNHEGRVFARIKNKTLDVRPDDHGLYISADLGGTELGRQLYEEIRGGYTDKMSFGFTVDGDEWVTDQKLEDGRDLYERRITSIRKLYDVSAVSIPANDATEISVRTLTDGVIEKVKAERLEAERLELMRRRTELRARARKGE